MAKKNLLHDLVHALESNEKRYFRLMALQNSKNQHHNLLSLFDALVGMEVYDESKIHKYCTAKTIRNNLPAARYQLYQLLLKSLRAFHAEKSNASYFRHRLEEISILFQKGLLAGCEKLIRKVRRRAEIMENQFVLLELTEWEAKLTLQNPPKNLEVVLQEMGSYKRKLIRQKLEEEELSLMYRQVLTYSKLRLTGMNPAQRSHLQQIIGHKLLAPNASPPQTTYAGILKNITCGIYAAMQGQHKESQAVCQPAFQALHSRPELVTEQPELYRIVVANLLNSCLYLHQTVEFRKYLTHLREIHFRNPIDQRRLQQLVFSQELVYCLNFGDADRGQALIHEIHNWMEPRIDALEPFMIFNLLYNSTIFHFAHGNFSSALFHLNRILNLRRSDVRKDLQDFAHIFQGIVHFEMEHHDLVAYQIRNATRYFKLQGRAGAYEKSVLRYLKSLLKVPRNSSEARQIYTQLNADLAAFIADTSHRRPPGVQELKFWVESKLKGEKIGDHFRKMLAAQKNRIKRRE